MIEKMIQSFVIKIPTRKALLTINKELGSNENKTGPVNKLITQIKKYEGNQLT